MSRHSKSFGRSTLTKAYKGMSNYKAPEPSNAALLEAKKAAAQAAADPLRFAFGDPTPGRSALDKLRREKRTP